MKKIYLLLSIFVFCFLLVSCKTLNVKHIEDSNGEDDFTLAVLTENDLYAKKGRSLSNMSVLSNTQGGAFNFRVDVFSGVKDLNTFTAKSGFEYTFEVDYKVTSGNSRFFIFYNGEILYEFVRGEKVTYTVRNCTGKVAFRLAGESAKVYISVQNV